MICRRRPLAFVPKEVGPEYKEQRAAHSIDDLEAESLVPQDDPSDLSDDEVQDLGYLRQS